MGSKESRSRPSLSSSLRAWRCRTTAARASSRLRSWVPQRVIGEIGALATSTNLSIRQIQSHIRGVGLKVLTGAGAQIDTATANGRLRQFAAEADWHFTTADARVKLKWLYTRNGSDSGYQTSRWLPSRASVFFTDAPKPFESWSSNHLMYNIISFWHVICLFSYGNRKEVSVRKHLLRATIVAGFIGLAPLAYANPISPSPTITSGNITFSNFTCSITGGPGGLACGQISVSAHTSSQPPDPTTGDFGIQIQGAFTSGTTSEDIAITYAAMISGGVFHDASMFFNGTVTSNVSSFTMLPIMI